MIERTLRGRVAIAGIGETPYYKHGQSPHPEFKLVLQAILAACQDAGLDPRDIDGFSSYANDRNEPTRLAAALGVKRLRTATLQWGGGGGGCAAAVANAAAAVAAGLSECVVVYRGLAQGEVGRFGQSSGASTVSGEMSYQAPYGVVAPPQKFAFRVRRYMHEHGIAHEALRAIALAAYHHAQFNPRAVMHGKPLDASRYDDARWIVEPFRLYDCCQENDGAAAVLVVSSERARDLAQAPAYILGAAVGGDYRGVVHPHNAPHFATAGYTALATELYQMAGLGPSDVGSVQAYENFTGAVVMSLAEHGFFRPDQANEFLTLNNLIAPDGRLPINTSGGNLAEGYMHGFELVVEAVRQVRGTSTRLAKRHEVALVIGAPLVAPASNLLLGSGQVL